MDVNLLASLLFPPTLLQSSLEATCYGSNPNNCIKSAWNPRDAVCSHGACAAGDSEQGNNQYCVVNRPFADTGMVEIQRHDRVVRSNFLTGMCSIPYFDGK